MSKVILLKEAVAQIPNGASIAIGGWGAARKPMAFLRCIARSNVRDLTIISFAGLDIDLLIGVGKVKKAIYPFVSLEGAPGTLGNFQRARKEWANSFVELSEWLFVIGLKAALERIPFYPARSGLGTDILTMNPEIKVIDSPYTKEKLVAMPAIKPDIALLHVNAADESGNCQIIGDPNQDALMAKSADKVFVTCERLLPQGELVKDFRTIAITSPWVTGVIEVPRGAHPGSCYPDYSWDALHLKEYSDCTMEAEKFQNYLGKYVYSESN